MSSMRAQCDAIPHFYDDYHPDDLANVPGARPGSRGWDATGPLRAWRHGYGYTSAVAGRLWGVTGSAVRQWERGARPVPDHVRVYLLLHPAPPTSYEYPPTPEGLRRAVHQWPTRTAWCRWWRPTLAYPTLFRYLRGQLNIPRPVQAWLAAGAPLTWQGRPAPAHAYPPPRPTPHEHVPADWIRLGPGRVAPPATYCNPERDALRLPGCAWCCYRDECAELQEGPHGH